MKSLLQNYLLLLVFMAGFSTLANGQARKKADKATAKWEYEIECMGTGTQGSYLIKVWSFSKKPHVALEQAKKNAVHGVLFKGFTGGGNGCRSQKPLSSNPNLDQEKSGWFKDFFADGGKYMKFVALTNNGAVGPGDRIKIKKVGYKVGVIVSVRKDELRKDLENSGILKGLSSGF